MSKTNDTQVDTIVAGLAGDLRIGQRYYIFTVTYAYIGRIAKLGDRGLTLDANDCEIVSRAGSEDDAVSKIVNGKKKPESSEKVGKPVCVFYAGITCVIPF